MCMCPLQPARHRMHNCLVLIQTILPVLNSQVSLKHYHMPFPGPGKWRGCDRQTPILCVDQRSGQHLGKAEDQGCEGDEG